MTIIVHTDGGARGNPGPAAIGVVIDIGGKRFTEFGKRIGETTNNVAEYTAVVEALMYIHAQQKTYQTIDFYLDSTLVVNQLNGIFKVKEPSLRQLLTQVRILESEVGGHIFYHSVPRADNARADFLVNRALDDTHVG